MSEPGKDFEKVFEGDVVEANLVKGKLESEGIPAYLRDENIASVFPLQGAPTGFGAVKVMVESGEAEAARKIISGT